MLKFGNIASLALCAVLLLGCGIGKDLGSGGPESLNSTCQPELSSELLTAFENSVYVVTQSRCVSCHGASQSPRFAVADSAAALQVSQPLMSGSPSRFDVKSGDGHCGANCGNSPQMRTAIDSYRAFVATIPSPSCSTTSDTVSNGTDPTGTAPVTPVTGQQVYDSYCMGCHRLGTYDTSGSPNLSGHEGDIDGKFSPGIRGHKSITLSASQISNLKAFVESY